MHDRIKEQNLRIADREWAWPDRCDTKEPQQAIVERMMAAQSIGKGRFARSTDPQPPRKMRVSVDRPRLWIG
ncbi:hypothetical protein AMR42_00655 [Limnothrix sp. PR1529]|nr:hypothetical protein BCR12_11885 [Limnothrix sp. P13C2]PIB15578.1 hypothetical protein AMR42_00655 [Limnothrix sp. PR1529]